MEIKEDNILLIQKSQTLLKNTNNIISINNNDNKMSNENQDITQNNIEKKNIINNINNDTSNNNMNNKDNLTKKNSIHFSLPSRSKMKSRDMKQSEVEMVINNINLNNNNTVFIRPFEEEPESKKCCPECSIF